MKGVCI